MKSAISLPYARKILRAALALAALTLVTVLIWKKDAMTQAIDRRLHADLPRFTELPAFDPYRKSFTCRHEAAVNPVPSDQAQALFEEAVALSDWGIPRKERDFAKIAALYRQAMALGHWKAQFNLAGLYLEGDGVPFDPDEAVRLTEDLMRQGVPAAWFNMGNYYMSGVGPLQPSATVAYAFWQRAADMGSLHAQAELGKALDALIDEPPRHYNNRPIGRQMLECAFAQGSGDAAYELGLTYEVDVGDTTDRSEKQSLFAKALQRLHEGVKFGSRQCADGLSAMYYQGHIEAGHAKDPIRARRYSAIGDYLRHHPDTRLPNLDRVLPLPPANLPPWDGEVESLIDAAKPVRVTPSLPKASAELQRTRAHVPEGYAIAPYEGPTLPFAAVDHRYGQSFLVRAPQDGYYQPLHASAVRPAQELFRLPERLRHLRDDTYERRDRDLLAQTPPLFYREGETLSLASSGLLPQAFGFPENARGHSSVYWRFVGTARPVRPLTDHLARAGLVQAIQQATDQCCVDGQICPTSGIWQPEVTNAEHPLAKVFNGTLAGESWRRQAFVLAGEPLPSLGEQLAPVLAEAERAQLQVQWRLMVACERACRAGFAPDSSRPGGA